MTAIAPKNAETLIELPAAEPATDAGWEFGFVDASGFHRTGWTTPAGKAFAAERANEHRWSGRPAIRFMPAK